MENNQIQFDKIEEALEDYKAGKPLIIADDEHRENEGDLIVAAQYATPDIIKFMAGECKGLICLAISDDIAKRLDLHQMVSENSESMRTAFTVSVDAHEKYGVTTGISAFDRAKTVEVVIAPDSTPSDLRRPGHMFPCTAKKGGVLARTGHTEAAVDMARLCGLTAAGVMCEIMSDDGTMARRDELAEFAKKYGFKFITVADLIAYRLKSERTVTREAEAFLPTEFGEFQIIGYKDQLTGFEHVALLKDDGSDKIPLVRVHSECLTGDIFHSLKCDCNAQLHHALQMVDKYGKGAVVYLRNHEGRGIGLINKIKAYHLQEEGLDTVDANVSLGFPPDLRNYGVGAQIILDLGFNNFKLITNNPKKIIGLKGYGLNIVETINLEADVTKYNMYYLKTKQDRMQHTFKGVL